MAGTVTIGHFPTAAAFRPLALPKLAAARSAHLFTDRHFRDALAQFATGVTVICARVPDGGYTGFTANSFNSVSLDPPLVLWSLKRSATNLPAFENAERYTINVLAHGQVELARRFSRPHVDRFAGVPFRMGSAGAPLIEGCVAWFECSHYARYSLGDHVLFIGEVETCERGSGAALLFHQHRYGITPPPERGSEPK
ncbi:MAG: flavin reductase family protein [Aromatoleum sp.]|nr:flavin reductase family protein [Aromatoleum sp.]